jgi:hypothetical protein
MSRRVIEKNMWDRLPVWEKKSAVMAANEGRRTLSI